MCVWFQMPLYGPIKECALYELLELVFCFVFLTIMLKKGLHVINCDIAALGFHTARVVEEVFFLLGRKNVPLGY